MLQRGGSVLGQGWGEAAWRHKGAAWRQCASAGEVSAQAGGQGHLAEHTTFERGEAGRAGRCVQVAGALPMHPSKLKCAPQLPAIEAIGILPSTDDLERRAIQEEDIVFDGEVASRRRRSAGCVGSSGGSGARRKGSDHRRQHYPRSFHGTGMHPAK